MRFLILECLTLLHAPIYIFSFYTVSMLYIICVVNEQVKRRAYDEHIREVERACFSPLVLSVGCGMGPSVTTVYRKLASMLADKWDLPYSRYVASCVCRC